MTHFLLTAAENGHTTPELLTVRRSCFTAVFAFLPFSSYNTEEQLWGLRLK